MAADMILLGEITAPARYVAKAALPARADSYWYVLDLAMVPADTYAVCPTEAKAADVQRGLELLEAHRLQGASIAKGVTGTPV